MSLDERRLAALILACLPLFAQAQGYKCTQPDGSVSYQDHACAAGAASSRAVQTGTGAGAGAGAATAANPLAELGIDAKCRQSMEQSSKACSSTLDVSLKACWRTRLSPACYAQLTAPAGTPRDAACLQQGTQSNCMGDAVSAVQRCMQGRLPASCKQQMTAAGENIERRGAACAPQVQRWQEQWRACGHRGLTGKEEEACLAAVQAPDCH